MRDKILAALKELREKSKKRNFPQSVDLIVSLKEFDIKKPDNKINEDVFLPNKYEDSKVVVFSDTVKDVNCDVLTTADIEKLAKQKRELKKMIRKTDFFLAEPKLMPTVGKLLGQLLAPKGLMPKLITPGSDVNSLVEKLKKSIRVKIKDSPVIQCQIGNEKMEDEKIVENVETVLKFLETKLPKGKHNIGKIMLKLTMSKPVKVGV
jgi:large subunit ribosomal protein L1